MEQEPRIIVALDFARQEPALALVERLDDTAVRAGIRFAVMAVVLMPLLLLASHDGPVPVVDPIAITLVRLVAPVLPVATALAGIVGLAVAASLLTHLGLGLSNPAARTKAPPLPGVVLELSGLAAWPERTRLGFGLFDAVPRSRSLSQWLPLPLFW